MARGPEAPPVAEPTTSLVDSADLDPALKEAGAHPAMTLTAPDEMAGTNIAGTEDPSSMIPIPETAPEKKKPLIDRYADRLTEKRIAREEREARGEPTGMLAVQRRVREGFNGVVSGLRNRFSGDPARREAAQARKTDRRHVRTESINARDKAMGLRAKLQGEGLSDEERNALVQEVAELEAINQSGKDYLAQTGRTRQLANKLTRKGTPATETELQPDELFKQLNDTRYRFLELGAKAKFNPLRTSTAYKRAQKAYQEAFASLNAALLAASEQEGKTPEELTAIATQSAIEEINAVEIWKQEIHTSMVDSRVGKAKLWFARQNLATKIVLGVAVGSASTLAVAGIASGTAIGMLGVTGMKAGKQLFSRGASTLAKSEVASLSDEEKAELTANIQDAHDADAVVGLIGHTEAKQAQKARWAGRGALALTVGAIAGGRMLGEWMNNRVESNNGVSRGGTDTPHGRPQGVATKPGIGRHGDGVVEPGSGAGGSSGEALPGTVTTTPAPKTEIVSTITKGKGLIENLTHDEVGLTAAQAAQAVEQMRAEGLLDGTHIAGVAERAGKIVVYARGAGDGALHFTDPRVLEIIEQAKASS